MANRALQLAEANKEWHGGHEELCTRRWAEAHETQEEIVRQAQAHYDKLTTQINDLQKRLLFGAIVALLVLLLHGHGLDELLKLIGG